MNKMLLLVDPQMDFISGSLPVPQAASKMSGLLVMFIKTLKNRAISESRPTGIRMITALLKKRNGPCPCIVFKIL